MNEIQEWLDSETKDFEKGLILFQKYSRNRSVFMYLLRKKDVAKLDYELQRLVALNPRPAENLMSASSILVGKFPEVAAANEVHKIMKSRQINREDLTEPLQKIYDGIADAYKLQRVYHEKMKLAETDEQRAELRAKVIECDEIIAFGWKQIDEELALPGASTDEAAPDVVKLVSAARTFISRAIKEFKPEKIEKITERIETLIKFKASVKAETRAKLIELHVINEDSNLLGE
jgi:hypothetical protein